MGYSTAHILKTMEDKGFPVFRTSSKNYNLNIIGIRTTDNSTNAFNDYMVALWFYAGTWHRMDFAITTDPGLYWRENPINVDGTAILKEGHHKGIWQLGLHKGQYIALVQRGIATVYRDDNKDEVLDMLEGTEQEGYFGINCHRASSKRESTQVDKWSAGCQVHANPIQYDSFMEVCIRAKENWGNSFSYTLLLDDWLDETMV